MKSSAVQNPVICLVLLVFICQENLLLSVIVRPSSLASLNLQFVDPFGVKSADNLGLL